MMQLNNDYQRGDFLKFLEEDFLTDFKKDVRPVNIGGLSSIQEANYLGESRSLGLQIFEFLFKGSPNKRVALTKDAFSVMRSSAIFRALAIFRSPNNKDWRFSLMTATPEPTEKGKVLLSYSNSKRLSFFLGPNAKINTPTKLLISKGKIVDFEDLKNRFSIEVVNKEFYKEISQAFTKLVGGLLKLPSTEDKSRANLEFAVRLIGRVIFCWFLREKKSLAGLALMPKELLSLETARETEDYYHKILEPIFFEVLNKQVKSRRDDFTKEPFSSVPYLNGGLFSPQEDDYYKRGNRDFQSQYHNTLIIPDNWFKDFFEILETYNFTIDENTSYDEELSIDPEMLGRIFENLLAEINPETGESARKSTGSYYTPRVIVSYMVDESLLLYLKEQTGISEEKLRAIISYDLNDNSENPVTSVEKIGIIDALEKVKILDPACGSGAFPMGALQKIVFILQQTDPEGQIWFKKQIGSTSPEIRKVLEREFANKNFDYIRKLGIIRENIYGIDIQPIATEISRLRCFLTLVVDQKVDDSLENRGIEPLPNLDFKFVTANSLIGLPQLDNPKNQAQQTEMFDNREKINKLKSIRDQYFTASGIGREQLKSDFINAQNELISQLVEEHGFVSLFKAELTQKLSSWEPFSHKSAGWLDPDWMFGIKDGFDIVIANPPYVDSETMVKEQSAIREELKNLYSTARGNWDLFIPFLELGFNLLSKLGAACFITPNKWFAIGYGEEIRKKLINGISRVGNCNSIKVFEAGNSPVITMYRRKGDSNSVWVDKFNEGYQVDSSIKIMRKNLSPNFGILLSSHLPLLIKIRSKENIISDFYKAENPCSVSEAYEIKKLLSDKSDIKDPLFFKFVNTGTIDSFVSLWGEKQTTYLRSKYVRPMISKDIFKDKFPKRFIQMSRSKLIISGMRHFESFLDQHGEYIAGKSTEILVQKTDYSLNLILGLLNSSLIRFYIKEVYGVLGIDGGINFTTDLINELPSPNIVAIKNSGIESLVNNIHKVTENNEYFKDSYKQTQVKEYKNQIDQVVYKLYGLTTEEIKVVEGNDDLS